MNCNNFTYVDVVLVRNRHRNYKHFPMDVNILFLMRTYVSLDIYMRRKHSILGSFYLKTWKSFLIQKFWNANQKHYIRNAYHKQRRQWNRLLEISKIGKYANVVNFNWSRLLVIRKKYFFNKFCSTKMPEIRCLFERTAKHDYFYATFLNSINLANVHL